MKIKLTLLMLSALLFNLSCKKPVIDDNSYPCLPVTILSKVSGTNRLGLDGSLKTVNMIFSYDSNNRLVGIKDGLKNMELTYHNWIISKLQYSDSTTAVPDRKVITLRGVTQNSTPIEEIESIYQGDQLISESRAKYTYTNEFATGVQRTFANNTTVVEKYTYQNGNIATYDNGKGITYSYKYDRKPNPFAIRFLQFRMGAIDFTSLNSVIEVEVKENGASKVSRSVYTYNQEGYPLTLRTLDSQGIVTVDYKFEYGSYQPGCY